MNLFIYVLLLSIWTSTCLNTNQSDGYSTTGDKDLEPTTLSKRDDFKEHLRVHVIGITCTVFIILSFCFLHYNCLNDDFPKAEAIKKCVAAKLSKSSILSLTRYKRDDSCIPEKQPMLSDMDKLSEPSGPEKSSSSSENAFCPSSPENPPSTENFIKPSRPKTASRKSYRKHSLSKSHKLAYAHKGSSKICSSFPNRAVRPPSPASLQHPLMPPETPYQNCPQNQILVLKSSSFQKCTKSTRYPNLKRSFSAGMVDTLSKSQLVNPSQYHKGKGFVCRNTSESFVNDISEAKKRNIQSILFPYRVKSFAKSFNEVDSKDNAFYDNVSDSDKMICDNDGDGEREK
ncbi:secreted glycoprotein, X-linked [Phyllostomus discolor]|uniref:Secreted glycoprotein, X-linked n=1 Tax=Phyllostomus discolor TaxID=89673 RepID=A0A6J2MKA0_9CHIR|nr:uncharacterized protein CXorf66 homolog [Phyllostomus discolor]KAF6090266.1 secreted glycoprotein, X-linked [Phyllostomus discolor]